jgi:hypothetical protein
LGESGEDVKTWAKLGKFGRIWGKSGEVWEKRGKADNVSIMGAKGLKFERNGGKLISYGVMGRKVGSLGEWENAGKME